MNTNTFNPCLNRSFCLILMICLIGSIDVKAFDLPRDLPTFEALMALHKQVKKDEDEALKNVATSFGEQTLVTKASKKFNDVRTTLDTKLNNAYSYVVLAAAISSTATGLYSLTNEYKDFTVNTYNTVLKKPFVAWYYTEANIAISREIKHCQRLYASMAAAGLNVMKASMDEKLDLVMTLKTSIDRVRAIIDNANLYCYLMTEGGWKPDYIWEILTSDVRDDIVGALIGQWNAVGENPEDY